MKLFPIFFFASVTFVSAAERMADYPAALEKAKSGGQDIAVLFHGSDWCLPGKKLGDYWKSENFAKFAGDDLLILDIDRKESPTAEDEATAKRNEACQIKPRSLPAIALFDREGRLVALREGTPELDSLGKPEQAIQRAVEVRKKRDDFWKKAEGARGPQKAGLLASGLDLLGLGTGPKEVYKPVVEEMKKADPEDRSGTVARYTFPGRKLLEKAVAEGNEKKFADADTEIGGWLKKPQLTKDQRQEALAAKFALYQRWPEKKNELSGVLKEIEKLDPKSELGTAAKAYLAMLAKEK
ncbi:hypothetical protein [Luteolibacter luteus]|uniref:Thioredoxin family protein n=1 Tax=Luteolibacter luteus TaxID=2728835 RepID=A0A858RMM2_9BACT|nr:hypothetical protein [Luteolibacter luteus]QJE97233.1 thioredoxin family protein [Luteolibacter luteus]